MTSANETTAVREAVAVFDDADSLEAAANELMSSGFDRSKLSLIASHKAVEAKLGHMYSRVEDVEDDPNTPTRAFVGAETYGNAKVGLAGALIYVPAVTAAGAVVASGGILAAVIGATAVAGGAGAMIGGLLSHFLAAHHAEYLQEQIDRGGLLLWVRTETPEKEQKATQILKKHSAHDVHVHGLPDSQG